MSNSLYKSIATALKGRVLSAVANGSEVTSIAEILNSGRRASSYLRDSLNSINSLCSILSAAPFLISSRSVGMAEGTDIFETEEVDIDTISTTPEEGKELVIEVVNNLNSWFDEHAMHTDSHTKYVFYSLPSGLTMVLGLYHHFQPARYTMVDMLFTCTATLDSDGNITDFGQSRPVMEVRQGPDDAVTLDICNSMVTIDGTNINYCDFTGALVDNSEVMSTMALIVDQCTSSNGATANTLITFVQSFLISPVAGVVQLANDCINSIIANGIYGPILVVVSYFKALLSAEYDSETGTLSFTDNTLLVPAQFLQGFMQITGTVISTVAGILIATGNWVIGAIGFLVGTGLSLIGQFLGVDPRETQLSLAKMSANTIPYMPHAIGQRACGSNEAATFYSNFIAKDDIVPKGIVVPGGILLCGQNSNGTIIYEFHPDLVDRRIAFSTFWNWTPGTVGVWALNSSLINEEYLNDYIDSMANDGEELDIHGDKDGFLSSVDTGEVQAVTATNFAVFITYCMLVRSIYNTNRSFKFDALRVSYVTSGANTGHVTVLTERGVHTYTAADITRNDMYNGPTTALASLLFSGLYFAGLVSQSGPTLSDSWPISMDFTDLGKLAVASASAYYDLSEVISGTYMPGLCNYPFLNDALVNNLFTGSTFDVPPIPDYPVRVPRYDATSFWTSIVISAAITVITIVTTVVATMAVKRAVRKQKLKNSLNVEKTYQQALKYPTDENLKSYQAAVFKNNAFTTIFGGTKYSKEGLWADATPSDDGKSSKFSSFLGDALSKDSAVPTIQDVVRLIKG